MSFELTVLAWTLVLALVQVLLPAVLRNGETGIGYNAGPRDKPAPPPRKLTGRLMRAQSNLFETLPVFAAAILIAHVAGREGAHDALGALHLHRRARGLRAALRGGRAVPALAGVDGVARRHHPRAGSHHLNVLKDRAS